jgi:hypothetical protein
MMWRHRCILVKDYETASLWRAVKMAHYFTVPEIVEGDRRLVRAEDWWDLEADLAAAGLKPR